MINDYCELFSNNIRGKYDKRLLIYLETSNLMPQDPRNPQGGAQIRSIFNSLLEEFTEAGITGAMTDAEIDEAIRMHEGDSLPGFPSPDTFEYLILPHLRKIQNPVTECLGTSSSSTH